MAVKKYIAVFLGFVLILPVVIGVDYSLLDVNGRNQTENLQTIQNLLNNQLKSFYDIPDSERNHTAFSVVMSKNCSLAFNKYCDSVVDFMRCTVQYARPIHICMECGNEYNTSVKSYEDIKEQGVDCEEFFFLSDQLGILDIIYSGTNDLWKKSSCQNCYDNYNETVNFFKLSLDLIICIENSNKSASVSQNGTCQECNLSYANLSRSYEKFVKWKEDYSGSICMDIIDTMNISRRIWTKYNCNIEFDTHIGFLNALTALTVGITPLMFYMLAKNISRLEDVKIVRPKRKFTTVIPPEQQE